MISKKKSMFYSQFNTENTSSVESETFYCKFDDISKKLGWDQLPRRSIPSSFDNSL